jgi:hypothetical protein
MMSSRNNLKVEHGLLKPNRATRHLLFSITELDRFLNEGGVS